MSFYWHWTNYSFYTTESNTRRVRHLLCWCRWFSFIFKRWTQLCIWKIFGIFAPLERGWNNCICNNRNEDIKDLHKIFQVIVHRDLTAKLFHFLQNLFPDSVLCNFTLLVYSLAEHQNHLGPQTCQGILIIQPYLNSYSDHHL